MSFDVLLRGGLVADGSGAAPVVADVAVTGERIADVGQFPAATAALVLNAAGRVVLPGLIDAHVHADGNVFDDDVQLALLRQGVTTVIVGQDGLSFVPAGPRTAAYVADYFAAVNGTAPGALRAGGTVTDLLACYNRATRLNVAYCAPHGTIRHDVLGMAAGRPNQDELAAMSRAVEQALDEGAVGLSSGLDYLPGAHASTEELVALCRPVARRGAVHVSHLRGYGAKARAGVSEACTIAADADVATHLSHLHGPGELLVGLLGDALAAGLDLTFDSYPYLFGASILPMLALPRWVQADGPQATRARLADDRIRRRLAREWFPGAADILEQLTITSVPAGDYAWTAGSRLSEAAVAAGSDVGEFVCDLLVAARLQVGCLIGQPASTDAGMRLLLRHPAQLAASDGIYLGQRPHPRGWGTFARLLGRHTRELHDYDVGEASWHLAGHAADRFGLAGRGRIRPGGIADLAVVDLAEVADLASLTSPRTPAKGVDDVFVNGVRVLADGALCPTTPGRSLRPVR